MKPTTGPTITIGLDEAGRGALAGPVVAGACPDIPLFKTQPLIRDSKCMTASQRETALAWIAEQTPYGVGFVESSYIDEHGILAATERAMQLAVDDLLLQCRSLLPRRCSYYLLVDGRDAFWFDHPHSSIIGGDATESCISAASIIAKVHRDRWMTEAAVRFPAYQFEQHKGYGTAAHRSALLQYGPSVLHRRLYVSTFLSEKPVAT